MLKVASGRVWKFGDNVSTDLMMPGQTLHGKVPKDEMHKYCMIAIRPEFPKEVKPGDIVVGGKNFGCGSSRPAPDNFAALKIGCVLASSFAAIFYRNAISIGLPVIELPGVDGLFQDGDQGEVDFTNGRVTNLTSSMSMSFPPYPDEIVRIIEAGGMLAVLRQEYLKEGRK